jgi:hypothetical protein
MGGNIVLLVCFFLAAHIAPAHVDAQSPLFSPAEIPAPAPPFDNATVIRQRYVTIDVEQLGKQDIRGLLLNLFPDINYRALLDRIDHVGTSLVWVGRIPNIDSSSVTLSLENRTVYGRIAVGESVYIVRVVRDDVHAIAQIDPAAFPPERSPITK